MDNDLEMFRKAGFRVAMGNASEAVKRAADAVTRSNEEDGFAAAIERFVFGG
jgi:hydroxymethylpyrimidine pyrophosphatase-like HAD family hydrolase